MQTVGLGDFRTTPQGGLILSSYTTRQLLADPAAEASRVAQVKLVIGEMLGELKIKGGKVNYSIAAQSVFTRFVKLPTVEPDKIDQIVQFEAQQNVPFPIEEVVWDYQLVATKDESKIEVVLVAIKADLLDELNGAVEDAGLETGVVDVAPMALYNAFRYNYADVSGCSLLLDVGARTTNLIFVEPNKVFSRSIPIGGTTFTTNITKEFNEPFADSEERKKASGFVSLGGAYAEPSDPDVARVSKIIRNSMTRLHSEITRSISFYRAQQGGSAPQQVYLCGGSVALPYIREFFAEKLQMPIEFFNPLRNVTVAGNVNLQEAGAAAHTLGELVGLAIRSASTAPMELNLEPASVAKKKMIARKRPFLIFAGVCLILSLLAGWFFFYQAAQVKTAVMSQLKQKVDVLKPVADDIDATKADIDKARAAADPFITAVKERDYWVRLIEDMNSRLPDHSIWVTHFEPVAIVAGKAVSATNSSGGPAALAAGAHESGLRIHGLYLGTQTGLVDAFAEAMKKSPFVSDVKVTTRKTSDSANWDFDYELLVQLKEGIAPQ